MHLQNRIQAFSHLGQLIRGFSGENLEDFCQIVFSKNNWFTPEETKYALSALGEELTEENLSNWISSYNFEGVRPKEIGILMAGNVPAVGFHDLMCVLLAGHHAAVKLSSTDSVLMQWIISSLIEIQPGFAERIKIEEILRSKDAYIATGSDNSARYFDYYFGKYPHIIRKNRTSVAVLDGRETVEELVNLGSDIFRYYGLGCRNVSKMYLKSKDMLNSFFKGIEEFSYVAENHKYFNNYEYNKSIFLVNQEEHLDNGFLLVKEKNSLVSPVAVLYVSFWENQENLEQEIAANRKSLQCIVSSKAWFPESIGFGIAQKPRLDDYADGVDTLAFLAGL